MSQPIATKGIHHLNVTVTDVSRTRAFRYPDNIQLELTAPYS